MNQILATASIIISVVLAVSSLVKSQISNAKRLPVINVLIGIFVSGAYAICFEPSKLAIFIWAGFIAGLAAGGFYDLGKGILLDTNQGLEVEKDDQENNIQ